MASSEGQDEEEVIDDTRCLHNGPFELLFGREFKLPVWEKWVREMLVGEVARFTCPYGVSNSSKHYMLANLDCMYT